MKTNLLKSFFIILFFVLVYSFAQAQDLCVKKTDGSKFKFSLDEIIKIKVVSGYIVMYKTDGKFETFPLFDLQHISMTNLNTGISFINEYTNDALILFPKSGNDEVSISIYDAKDFNNHIEVLSTEGKAVFMQDNVLFSEINFVKLSSLPVGDFLCKEVNGRIVMKKNSMIL